jgi:hypothetical protein
LRKTRVNEPTAFRIRLAQAADDDFILGLVGRFVEFELPAWRKRNECAEGIRRDVSTCRRARTCSWPKTRTVR